MSMFWGTNALFPSSFFHGIKSFLPCLLSQKSIAAVRFLVNKPQHEIDPNYWSSVNIRGAITAITIRTSLVTFRLRGVSAIQHNIVGRKGCYLLWCALSFPRQKIIWEARAGPRLIDISAYGDKKSYFEIHGWNLQLQCFGSCSHPPPPRPQLRCVFDACDTTGSGLISLRQLANVSRSHVNGATQVLAILKSDIGPNGGATINVLLCLDRWSRSWTYLTLGKTGLKTTNSTSVSFTQRCGSFKKCFFLV